jgi:DNA-binding NtrC family response regulator
MKTAGDCSSKDSIIVVDSQVLIHDFIKSILDDTFQVVSVYSAENALNRLKDYGPFDAVISSQSLTGMNGLELLRKVHQIYPNTVRILMSGSDVDNAEIKHALSEGHLTRFLPKPFSPSALKSLLTADLAIRK